MPRPIYSSPFFSLKGLGDDTHRVTVPDGHVHVVRAVAVYAHTVLDSPKFALKNYTTDVVMLFQDWTPASRQGTYFDVHIAIGARITWGPSVDSGGPVGDGVDVTITGYDLLGP